MSRTIGSSSVPAVFGLSPYATAADVQSRLLGGSGGGAGWAADLGNLLEAPLRAELERKLDRPVHPGPPYGAEPWVVTANQHSHPDGWTEDGGIWITEIKTLSSWDGWDDPDAANAAPRPDYGVQVIHQQEARCPAGEIVGALVYALNVETGERRLYRVPRKATFQRLIARVEAWYVAHVIEAQPVVITAPAAYLPKPKRVPVVMEPDDDITASVERLRVARAAAAVAAAEEEAAKVALIERLGSFDGVKGLLSYTEQDTTRVVPARVRDLADHRPDLAPLLAGVFETKTSRVMRILKEKK